MAVKSFQAKIICASPSQRECLELTHRLFNEHLTPVLSTLYAALKGRHGAAYQRILASAKGAQGAFEQVESVTSLKSKTGQGRQDPWKLLARQLLADGKLLFDRERVLPGFSSEFRRKAFSTAFQIILSHKAKLKQWHEEHDKWLAAKAQWERENAAYMAVRPIIEQFSAAEGKVAKRRGRWHRWLNFLSGHPELAGWRGGPATVVPLTKAELAQARRHRRRAVANAFAAFFAKNPELEELDRLHGFYQREYVRPWAKRRHADGFKHAPTFTLPSAVKHPAWFSFKKNATYRNLDLSAGTIELKLIRCADPEGRSPKGFVACRFRCDARLRRFHRAPEKCSSGREQCDLVYDGDDGLPPRPGAIKGVKLVLRNGQPYLYFTAYVEEAPARLSIKQASIDKYSLGWTRGKILGEALDPPLRTMAIDLGIRHLAVATVMAGDRLVGTRFIHNRPTSPVTGRRIDGIATLDQIAAMKRAVRRKLRQRGKPVKGQESCRRLGLHIRRMSEDRFKKCAVAIIDVARALSVDVLLMEKLEGLIPDAERERGINRAIVNWNRGQLCRWIKMVCEEYGLRVIEVPPFWTSQVCHRCNHLGQRYSLRDGVMTPQPVGKLFGCPACAYRCNADFNASINLHRVFLGSFPDVKRHKARKGHAEWNGQVIDLGTVRAAWEAQYARLKSPF